MQNNPYFLLIITPLIWAGNTIAGRLAVGEISPMTLVFLRWFFTLIFLLPFVLPHLKKDWTLIKEKWGWFLVYGSLGFALFNLLYYIAANYTTAINLTLIQSAIPMIILLINCVFYRQKLSINQLVGLFITIVGVMFIITQGNLSALRNLHFNFGDMLMLVAGFSYSIYSIFLRYKPIVSWLSFIFVSGFFALLVATPFALYEVITTENDVVNFSIKSFFLLLYVSVIVSVISQIAFAKAVGIIGSSRAGIAINLVPVFGVLLAIIVLGETFHWYHFAGFVLVFSGIAISERLLNNKNK